MDSKLNVNDFPTSNGISKIPTELLTKMIKIYNDSIDEEFENRTLEKYKLIKEGKIKTHTEEEFFTILEESGL